MPVKRKYNVKGSKDFLVLGLIFFFLCLWSIKDAWFPSDKVLKKHPLTIAASFETAGAIEKIFVDVDGFVSEGQVIAKLRTDRMIAELERTKTIYTEARERHERMALSLKKAEENGALELELSDIQTREEIEEKAMGEARAKIKELQNAMDLSELISPSKGTVLEVKVGTHSMVEAGDAVVIIDPKDHFYLFNKSLAILSFFAFWAFLAIHVLAS